MNKILPTKSEIRIAVSTAIAILVIGALAGVAGKAVHMAMGDDNGYGYEGRRFGSDWMKKTSPAETDAMNDMDAGMMDDEMNQ